MTSQDANTATAAKPAPASSVRSRLFLLVLLLLLCLGSWAAYATYRQSRNPRPRFDAAIAALKRGDLDAVTQAVEYLQAFDAFAPHRHYLQGALLLRAGNLPKALEELKYSQFHPDTEIDTLILRGQIFYRMGQANRAAEQWRKALRIDEDSALAHRMLGRYFYDLGAMGEALKHLEIVSVLEPQDASALRMMGTIHFDYDQFADAVKDFRESLRRESQQPQQDELLMDYGSALVQLREYQEAAKILAQATRSAKQLTLLAECQWNLGQADEALSKLDDALTLQPTNVDALLLQGKIFLNQSKAESAVQSLQKAVELAPLNYEVNHELAGALRIAGRMDEAKKRNDTAMAIGKDYERFSALNLRAIEEPTNIELRIEIAELARKLGRPELARDWFRAALILDPANERAIKGLQSLDAASGAAMIGPPKSP